MKINLNQLLPLDISDEAAFHLVQFTRSLAIALESIYFDKMLKQQSRDLNPDTMWETGEDPF